MANIVWTLLAGAMLAPFWSQGATATELAGDPMDPGFLRKEIAEFPPVTGGMHMCPRGVDGLVRLTFDVDEHGATKNIVVRRAEPKGYFERNALNYVRSWSYEPYLINGKSVTRRGLESVIIYDPKNYCD